MTKYQNKKKIIKSRVGYINISTYTNKVINGNKICLNCDNPVKPPKRRYCSEKCQYEFYTKNSHAMLRSKLIVECNGICYKCKKKFTQYDLILDHIIPIAMGGEEFNEDNLQILCKECNKIKTKKDMGDIARFKNIERMKEEGVDLNKLLEDIANGTNISEQT